MELEFTAKISFHHTERFDKELNKLKVSTNCGGGRFSNKMLLYIVEGTDEDDEGTVFIEFNKNEARYLHGFLTSFIDEQDIDIDAED